MVKQTEMVKQIEMAGKVEIEQAGMKFKGSDKIR